MMEKESVTFLVVPVTAAKLSLSSHSCENLYLFEVLSTLMSVRKPDRLSININLIKLMVYLSLSMYVHLANCLF